MVILVHSILSIPPPHRRLSALHAFLMEYTTSSPIQTSSTEKPDSGTKSSWFIVQNHSIGSRRLERGNLSFHFTFLVHHCDCESRVCGLLHHHPHAVDPFLPAISRRAISSVLSLHDSPSDSVTSLHKFARSAPGFPSARNSIPSINTASL
jgi:hypothetical protein